MNHQAWALKVLAISFMSFNAFAAMPTNPVTDRDFTVLPGGKKLTAITVNGRALSLTKGVGVTYGSTAQSRYLQIKERSLTDRDYKTQWTLMDLDANRVLAESLDSNRRIFGASSSKIFVGGALLDKQQGQLDSGQLQLMANMLVVSSNQAWVNLQAQLGDGSSNQGRAAVAAFTEGLGLEQTRGYQGYWGSLHGNELTAQETAQYLAHIYKADFEGAETLWKLMHTCRTGASRGLKYLPEDIFVGGKTGTFSGTTVDPETGASISVSIKNHVLVFNVLGRQYGLAILSDGLSDDEVAALAGGLFFEYTGYGQK